MGAGMAPSQHRVRGHWILTDTGRRGVAANCAAERPKARAPVHWSGRPELARLPSPALRRANTFPGTLRRSSVGDAKSSTSRPTRDAHRSVVGVRRFGQRALRVRAPLQAGGPAVRRIAGARTARASRTLASPWPLRGGLSAVRDLSRNGDDRCRSGPQSTNGFCPSISIIKRCVPKQVATYRGLGRKQSAASIVTTTTAKDAGPTKAPALSEGAVLWRAR